jgi:hypothetical protein
MIQEHHKVSCDRCTKAITFPGTPEAAWASAFRMGWSKHKVKHAGVVPGVEHLCDNCTQKEVRTKRYRLKDAGELVRVEREDQIKKGYTAKHDDQHAYGELAVAAAKYALPNDDPRSPTIPWPFGDTIFHPTEDDRLGELIKASALIFAEIERIKRSTYPLTEDSGSDRTPAR